MNQNKTILSHKIFASIGNYGAKISVLLMFFCMFASMGNPGRISKLMGSNASVVKNVFYFRGVAEQFLKNASVADEKSGKSLDSSMDASDVESDSYEDFYAAFAQMMEDSSDYDDLLGDDFSDDLEDDFEDDFEDEEESKEKITVKSFGKEWKNFKENHSDIASALLFDRLISILLFISVLACVAGIFLSYSSGIFTLISKVFVFAGSAAVIILTVLFTKASYMLSETLDEMNVEAIEPSGSAILILLALCTIIFSILFIVFSKKIETSESEKTFALFPFQVAYRIISMLLFVLMFIPAVNPSRISENINRNVSLFTSGFSYKTYTEGMKRIFIRGWLPESVMVWAWIFSMIICLGIIACVIGSCMSVGNNKMKRIGHFIILGGSSASFVSLFGILHSYNLIYNCKNFARVEPVQPSIIPFYYVLLAVIIICSLLSLLHSPKPEAEEKCKMEPQYQLFLMLLPCLILVFLFSYLPLWGWRYALFDYNPGDTLSMDAWVGLKWFKYPFENAATRADIARVMVNTLSMSGLGILGSWLPMAFAIFLAEIKNTTARKVIQTLTTIPNFISWVLVYAIAFCIFGTQGFISSFMVNHGFWDSGVNMLMGDKAIWIKMWLWGIWKGLGWSAIMYIAAISGIDQQLYEAATVDGANRFQKIMHITVPELLPTYLVLLILSISGLLSNGMDQYLVFKNPTNKGPIEVLDLYVYQISFGSTTNSNIPFSTVVSMFKSLVSVVLLFITNKISKWIRGTAIF